MVLPEDVVSPALTVAVIAFLLASAAVIRSVDPEVESFVEALRSRFVYGVPWGTLVTIGLVLLVYLFVQGGWTDWDDPVTIPFRAWSYFYPTGMVLAGVSHNSTGHLIGNLTATAVLGPLAEYAWSHYPQQRQRVSTDASLSTFPFDGVRPGADRRPTWVTVPWVRAVVVFPIAAIGVAVATSLFALGPVIGFSGAVFALGGFALVRYPLATVVALLARRGTSTVYDALTDPVVTAGTSPSPPSPPGWATIAVQGHALGIITGIVLGLALLRYRNQDAPAGRLWLATFLFGTVQGLWAVYWFLGDGEYVLYRGVGVVLVTMLALLVVGAASAPDRPWFPDVSGETLSAISWRGLFFVVLVVGLALIAGPSIYPNLATPGGDAVPNEQSVEVRDYELTYAENARNQMIPGIDVPYLNLDQQTNVTTSGVIVVSEQRGIWTQGISRQRLAFSGTWRTHVGGVGWRERVTASRMGWEVVGNRTVYTVALAVDDDEPRHVFDAPNSTAEPTVADRNVTLVAHEDGFDVAVTRDGDRLASGPIPDANESTTVGGLDIVAEDEDGRTVLFAERDGTRVRVATEEAYE